MGFRGGFRVTALTRVGGPFPVDMADSEVRGVEGHYEKGDNERIPWKGGEDA